MAKPDFKLGSAKYSALEFLQETTVVTPPLISHTNTGEQPQVPGRSPRIAHSWDQLKTTQADRSEVQVPIWWLQDTCAL